MNQFSTCHNLLCAASCANSLGTAICSHGERGTSAKRNSFCHWPSNRHRPGLHKGTALQILTASSQESAAHCCSYLQLLQIVSQYVTMTVDKHAKTNTNETYDKTCQNMPKQRRGDHRCAGKKIRKGVLYNLSGNELWPDFYRTTFLIFWARRSSVNMAPWSKSQCCQ